MAEEKENTITLNVEGVNVSEDDDWQYIHFSPDMSEELIVSTLKTIFDFENIPNHKNIAIEIKQLPTQKKIAALKYAMTREDLHDDYMITNVYNLLKTYNSFTDSYFNSKYCYINNQMENMAILKALKEEIKALRTKISWYLLCMMKSYNKVAYTTQDTHIELPVMYQVIFMGTDMTTLLSIFSISNPINTESLVYVDNSFMFLNTLFMRAGTSGFLLNDYLKELEDNGTLVPESEE